MSYEEIVNKTVRCRKPHTCIWCGGELKKGDKAVYRFYTFWGEKNSDYLHPECLNASATYDHQGEGWEPYQFVRGRNGQLWELAEMLKNMNHGAGI